MSEDKDLKIRKAKQLFADLEFDVKPKSKHLFQDLQEEALQDLTPDQILHKINLLLKVAIGDKHLEHQLSFKQLMNKLVKKAKKPFHEEDIGLVFNINEYLKKFLVNHSYELAEAQEYVYELKRRSLLFELQENVSINRANAAFDNAVEEKYKRKTEQLLSTLLLKLELVNDQEIKAFLIQEIVHYVDDPRVKNPLLYNDKFREYLKQAFRYDNITLNDIVNRMKKLESHLDQA